MNRLSFFVLWRTLMVCCVIGTCSVILFAASCMAQESTEMTTVQGLGYPPIRAENSAQAYLMAKRAAVVDAYRNAIAAKSAPGQGSDIQYEELSGFVRGMTVVKEEYLKDGGLRITATVLNKHIQPSVGTTMRRSDSRNGPQSVTLDEWYSIISKLVRYE